MSWTTAQIQRYFTALHAALPQVVVVYGQIWTLLGEKLTAFKQPKLMQHSLYQLVPKNPIRSISSSLKFERNSKRFVRWSSHHISRPAPCPRSRALRLHGSQAREFSHFYGYSAQHAGSPSIRTYPNPRCAGNVRRLLRYSAPCSWPAGGPYRPAPASSPCRDWSANNPPRALACGDGCGLPIPPARRQRV